MLKNIFIFIIALILVIALFWFTLQFIYREKLPKADIDTLHLLSVDLEQSRQINYAVYNQLLYKYVADGMVDYISWKNNNFAIFDRYIRSLKYVELKYLSIQQRKVFWINAYNALTIYAVLKRIPENQLLAKTFSVQMVPGFFDKIEYEVAGESLTLNDIENEKLRKSFGDPRVHFALVCASRSCPEIQREVFKEAGLKERLDKAAQNFIQDTTMNRLDQKNNVLYLSEIFRWYDSDFIASDKTVVDFVKKYMGKEDSEYLSTHTVKMQYIFYDWLVNIKR